MLRAFAVTLFSLMMSGSGLYLGYLFLASLKDSSQPLFLLGALPLVVAGIYLLLKSSKTNALLGLNDEVVSDSAVARPNGKFENVLQKNNRMVEEWIKESEAKDKLKILEITAAAEEESEKKIANAD